MCLNKYFYQTGKVDYLISSVETYLLCMDLIDQLRMTLPDREQSNDT